MGYISSGSSCLHRQFQVGSSVRVGRMVRLELRVKMKRSELETQYLRLVLRHFGRRTFLSKTTTFPRIFGRVLTKRAANGRNQLSTSSVGRRRRKSRPSQSLSAAFRHPAHRARIQPPGIFYRPAEKKLQNIKARDYLGKAVRS